MEDEPLQPQSHSAKGEVLVVHSCLAKVGQLTRVRVTVPVEHEPCDKDVQYGIPQVLHPLVAGRFTVGPGAVRDCLQCQRLVSERVSNGVFQA